jgi:hypothetical protein
MYSFIFINLSALEVHDTLYLHILFWNHATQQVGHVILSEVPVNNQPGWFIMPCDRPSSISYSREISGLINEYRIKAKMKEAFQER